MQQEQDTQAIQQLLMGAVEGALFHPRTDSFNVDMIARLAAGVSSSQYAQRFMKGARRFANAHELIEFACSVSPAEGLVLEFGVFSGRTINCIANVKAGPVYGFDSFEGLPEDWRPEYGKGAFARTDLPPVAESVELIVGWFDRTLPAFMDAHPGPASFVHVDCDLYSSTQTVFAQIRDRIVAGTVFVFDEYFNYPGWEMHEFKAFREFCDSCGIQYEYIGLVPHHQQVAVRVTAVVNR